jgi:hypothetical protein
MEQSMGTNSLFNTRTVVMLADGIPLDRYGADGADAVIALFAIAGLFRVLLAMQGVAALIRYRAMIPFLYLLLLILHVGSKALLLDADGGVRVGHSNYQKDAVWSEDDVTWNGSLFSFEHVSLSPKPAIRLDTWYGGTTRASVRRAVAHCDGWLPGRLPLATLDDRLALLAELAVESGHRMLWGAIPIVCIDQDRKCAFKRIDVPALAGSSEVLDAAFRRCGVLRVERISDLFYMAEVLGKQPRPKGPRLAIITNAGGPGVLATDALITSGGQLAELSPATIESLNKILPPHWSHGNPVDILGDAPADRYAKAVEIVARDANADGLLVTLAPQAMTDSALTAEQLKPYAKLAGKLCTLEEELIFFRAETSNLESDVVCNNDKLPASWVLRRSGCNEPSDHTMGISPRLPIYLGEIILIIQHKFIVIDALASRRLFLRQGRVLADSFVPADLDGLPEKLREVVDVLRAHQMCLVSLWL